MLRVGVDLDGVLNNLGETMLREFISRSVCSPDFSMDQVTEYDFEKIVPGVTGDMVWEVIRDGDVFRDAHPNPSAVNILPLLMEAGVKIHIVTSRNFSQFHRKITEDWLRRHHFQFDRLAIQSKKDKANYAEAHRLDVFIEDHLPTAEAMTDVVRCSILLDQPYNQWDYQGGSNPEPPNLIRMFSWEEIEAFFLRF